MYFLQTSTGSKSFVELAAIAVIVMIDARATVFAFVQYLKLSTEVVRPELWVCTVKYEGNNAIELS